MRDIDAEHASNWFDDTLTDKQLDTIRRDLHREVGRVGAAFSRFAVRKLVAEIDRLRAQLAATTPMRTPEQWCAHYGVEIHDPDGWRSPGAPAWTEPITLLDFWERASRSTKADIVGGNWNQVGRDARATDGGVK